MLGQIIQGFNLNQFRNTFFASAKSIDLVLIGLGDKSINVFHCTTLYRVQFAALNAKNRGITTAKQIPAAFENFKFPPFHIDLDHPD